jgi:hypothetical protein
VRPRQRLRAGGSGLARTAGRALAALVGLALVLYGAGLVALAAGASPSTVNAVTGYRTAFDALTGLTPADIGSQDRIVVAVIGVVVGLLAAWLAWSALPRPHLARTDVELRHERDGVTTVTPRAIERVAETAALRHHEVTGARARCDDGAVAVDIATDRAEGMAQTLRAVRDSTTEQLVAHGLSADRVDVTITAYDRPKGRTLR